MGTYVERHDLQRIEGYPSLQLKLPAKIGDKFSAANYQQNIIFTYVNKSGIPHRIEQIFVDTSGDQFPIATQTPIATVSGDADLCQFVYKNRHYTVWAEANATLSNESQRNLNLVRSEPRTQGGFEGVGLVTLADYSKDELVLRSGLAAVTARAHDGTETVFLVELLRDNNNKSYLYVRQSQSKDGASGEPTFSSTLNPVPIPPEGTAAGYPFAAAELDGHVYIAYRTPSGSHMLCDHNGFDWGQDPTAIAPSAGGSLDGQWLGNFLAALGKKLYYFGKWADIQQHEQPIRHVAYDPTTRAWGAITPPEIKPPTTLAFGLALPHMNALTLIRSSSRQVSQEGE